MGSFRRYRFGVSVLAALSLVAAACGDDDDDDSTASVQPTDTGGDSGPTSTATGSTAGGSTTTTAPAVPDDLDPNGVLKYGAQLIVGTGIHFDPTQLRAPSGAVWLELIYGTLSRPTADGTFGPWMAEDLEVVDPQTVRIRLRPGVTFTDGSAYDATAVSTSLMRQRFEPASEAVANALHPGLKAMTRADVVDPLTVDVHLDQPIASMFIEAISERAGFVQSPKQIAENPGDIDLKPIGAGPYTMEQYLPEQRIELRKNPNFWDADSWRMTGIDIVHTPLGPQQAQGLLTDSIDFNLALPVGGVEALAGDSEITTLESPGRFSTMLLCSTKPPFDNESIRQAMMIGIDRNEYNELVYSGKGEPAYGVYPEGHPSYDPETADIAAFDLPRAQQLVANSGVANPSFEIAIVSSNNFARQAEAMQAQLQRIGISTTIRAYNNIYDEWILPQAPGALFTYITGQPVGGFIHLTKSFTPGQSNSFCSTSDPELIDKINQAVQLASDDPKSVELFREANRLLVEHALYIPVIFEPFASAWNESRVGGTPEFSNETGQPRLNFESIYVKK